MWSSRVATLLTRLNITYPIIQAPMAGGATTSTLVAAVANAGGLGSLAAGYMQPKDIRATIQDIRRLTQKPFSVNLFTPQSFEISLDKIKKVSVPLNKMRTELGIPTSDLIPQIKNNYQEQIDIICDEKVPIFSFTFGIPSADIIQRLKSNNTMIIGTATTVDEGVLLERSGCDAIVAQGSEAGGHRGTFDGEFTMSQVGTIALIPQLVDAVSIPVIAAGGIMDGRGLAAAIALGANGVQMGTAFLTCNESGASRLYKNALLASNEASTVVTSTFSGKPARGLHNEFIKQMADYKDSLPDYPILHTLTSDIRAAATKLNNPHYPSFWAGQGTRLSKTSISAADLIKLTVEEAKRILSPEVSIKSKL